MTSKKGFLFLLFFLPAMLHSTVPFAFVMMDEQLESRFGKFPWDRSAYAGIIDALYEYEPKAIIIKLFLDQPRSQTGDQALAKAMSNRNVILQASLQPGLEGDIPDGQSHDLDIRFNFGWHPNNGSKLRGYEGWIPLPVLQDQAADVGFPMLSDSYKLNRVPLYVEYRTVDYKSLWYIALEQAYPSLILYEGSSLAGQNWMVRLTPDNEIKLNFLKKKAFSSISMSDIMNKKVPADIIKNKVVILYLQQSPQILTQFGYLRVHDIFNQVLMSIISTRKKAPK